MLRRLVEQVSRIDRPQILGRIQNTCARRESSRFDAPDRPRRTALVTPPPADV